MTLFQNEIKGKKDNNFFADYLNQLWDNVLNNNIETVFFDLAQEDFSSYIKNNFAVSQEVVIANKTISVDKYLTPYYPFLDYIKEFLQQEEINIEQYLEKAGVYYFQKSVFANFLKGEKTYREEEIIFEELDYERKRIYDSIIKLLLEITETKPLIMLIENLHLADKSTFDFISYLLEHNYQGQLMLIFSFNRKNPSLFDKDENDYWSDFLDEVELKGKVIATKKDNRDFSAEEDENKSLASIEELIDLSNDCFNFLSLSEAKRYIMEAYNRYQDNEKELTEKYYIKLLDLLGDVHMYLLTENDTALIYYKTLLNHLKKTDNKRALADAYRKNAMIHYKKYNMETAEKMVNQSLNLAREIEADSLKFKAYFLICLIHEEWRNYNIKQWRKLYNNLMTLGEKLKSYNIMARCYIYFYEVVDFDLEDVLPYLQKGLKIAKKYNNEYRIAVAYQIRALLYTRAKKYDKVLEYYKKSEAIRKKINSKNALAMVYNGLGHYHTLVENYEQSYEYYNKSLYASRKIKNYHEIGMTCFNLSLTLFLAFEHDKSIFYANKILEIFKILQMKRLKYHSRVKIYSLLGINYLKENKLAKAQACMVKIKIEMENGEIDGRDNYELFFWNFFQALNYKQNNNYKKSKLNFKKSLKCLKKMGTTEEHILPRYYYEYVLMLQQAGEINQSNKLLKQGVEYCKKLDYSFYQAKISALSSNKEKKIDYFDFKENDFDFKWIAESAQLEETLNKLYNQIDKVKFLNRLQNLLVEAATKNKLIKQVMELINQNFLAEESYFYFKEAGGWKNYFKKNNLTNPKEDLAYQNKIKRLFIDLVKNGEKKLVYNIKQDKKYEKTIGEFSSFIFIPLEIEKEISGGILCLTLGEELKLTEEDLNILSIACKQLAIALERIKRDNQLRKAYDKVLTFSRTDYLTGLYNRYELIKKLNSEREKLKRYDKEGVKKYSIMFVDLDNFKYYNDQFGHKIGDLVLCEFANLLEDISRESDLVSRFGGDEFVIALPETNKEEVLTIAKRIQQKLKAKKQFKQEIEEKLDEKVSIAQEDRLTCSIGIAEYNRADDIDSDQLLNRADKALYKAKEAGKDKIIIWDEDWLREEVK